MSFVSTLAKLAAGYAAARGVDHYRKMGGMAGLKETYGNPEMLDGMADQLDQMMAKVGIPGAGAQLKGLMDQFGGGASAGGEAAMAGLGGLMSALGGSAAAGTSAAAEMMDSLTGNGMASASVEDNARLMIRAMIQAAKADGEIDAEEKDKLLEHLEGASQGEIDYVREQLAAPSDLNALLADTGEAARAQVYAMSVMAIRADTDAEKTYLDQLAKGLGLSDATRARVHSAMGVS